MASIASPVIATNTSDAYIVEGGSAAQAARAVREVGARVTHELPIIDGVSAELSPAQAARLHRIPTLTLVAAGVVKTQTTTNTTIPDIYQRAMIGVNDLASQGIDGTGVLVAVLDSGIQQSTHNTPLTNDLNGTYRIAAQFDAINNLLVDAAHPCRNYPCVNDDYGHGSHIASLIASSDCRGSGRPQALWGTGATRCLDRQLLYRRCYRQSCRE